MLQIFSDEPYILKSDTKRRALAYQVAHTHRKLKLYDQLDPTTEDGKRFREYLGPDADQLFGQVPLQVYPKMLALIKSLTAMLAKPDFFPIEQEWQAMKKKDPAWYSLFGGPQNARELASHVGWALMYDFCYRHWSEEVHAGSAMEAAGLGDGEFVMRPIRHPGLLQNSLVHAMNFTLQLSLSLVESYAPEKKAGLKRNYVDKIHKRKTELLDKTLITAPWQNSSGV